MPIDVLPKTRRRQQLSPPAQLDHGSKSTYGRWWRRGLLATCLVAAVASAAALIPGIISSREIGPRLTHTISRGDLIVTITEQGTLESSVNTEIKCQVRGADIPIIWVIEGGSVVEPGDVLVRLETLAFEDRVNEVTKWAHVTRSAAERSKADLARAELALSEYLEGRYRSELMTMEKDLAIAESNLRNAKNMLDHANMMADRGYISALEVEERAFAVTRSELRVGVNNTQIRVLKDFTRAMELETLNGNLKATKARHEANKERAKSLAAQIKLCFADRDYCTVKAERGGLVVHPSAEPWKYVPEIEAGANVYMGQTMLIMPDVTKMQVKIGIDESAIDLVKPGLTANVTLPDKILNGEVSSVASVTGPAGWWNGNAVEYDTVVKFPEVKRLQPGMSAVVEVIIARHEDVLTIPVAAVVATAEGDSCWIKTADGPQRRAIELGDTNKVFSVVKAGLKEDDEVFLNPFAFEGIQPENLKSVEEARPKNLESSQSGKESERMPPKSEETTTGPDKPERTNPTKPLKK